MDTSVFTQCGLRDQLPPRERLARRDCPEVRRARRRHRDLMGHDHAERDLRPHQQGEMRAQPTRQTIHLDRTNRRPDRRTGMER